MIEIRNLCKNFGPLRAVDGVSFTVERGEVLGFLGPNGAGKSTTMKMITGFLAPDGGRVRVCGHDVALAPIAVKSNIGYLPEGAPLYADMTPAGLLAFVAEVRDVPASQRAARIREVVSKVHIEGVMHQRIDTLSKGFKRRVGIAQAILHDPQVLILDEPTDGLDPNQKHEVRTLIREMAKDKVIVLSTHILEEVDAVCTRAIIIANGRLLFDGTPRELMARSSRHHAIALTLKSIPSDEARQAIADVDGVAQVEALEGTEDQCELLVHPSNGASILGSLSRLAHERGWEVDHLSVERGRLDEVFRDITTGAAAGSGQAAART